MEIATSLWLLTSNPFSKAFLTRFGERAADQVIDFLGWIKEKVVYTIEQHTNERVLFKFTTPYKGCQAKFVIASKDAELLIRATDSVNEAARSAIALIDRIEHLEPNKLVYEFDLTIKQWLPRHAATKKAGVISDRPALIAVDKYKGFSIGGSATYSTDEG